MERIIRHLRANVASVDRRTEVLIVSDDTLLSLDLEMSLEGQGLSPTVSGFPAMALMALTHPQAYAAVILDIEKPEEASANLLEWLSRGQSPVIVVSTFDQDAVTGLPPGTVWYSKPLAVDEMVAQSFPCVECRDTPNS